MSLCPGPDVTLNPGHFPSPFTPYCFGAKRLHAGTRPYISSHRSHWPMSSNETRVSAATKLILSPYLHLSPAYKDTSSPRPPRWRPQLPQTLSHLSEHHFQFPPPHRSSVSPTP